MNEKPDPKREVELWRVQKDERELRCVAVYLSIGIDVRLMESKGFGGRSFCGMLLTLMRCLSRGSKP